MASDVQATSQPEGPAVPDSVEMPRPTAAPLVLALGLSLLAAGVALGLAFLVVGAVVVVAALSLWIVQLLPGRGHVHEPLAEPARLRRSLLLGGVEQLRPGMPGYRLRLPQDVHPISAGIKGGIVGGAVMPVPALLWGILSGHGLWYPVNLLAGMVLPGVDRMTIAGAGTVSRLAAAGGAGHSCRDCRWSSASFTACCCRRCRRSPGRSPGAGCSCPSCGRARAT